MMKGRIFVKRFRDLTQPPTSMSWTNSVVDTYYFKEACKLSRTYFMFRQRQ